MHELRLAVRSLLRAPGFTTAAVLTLALGIGAATAVFSVANGVLLRPLPYASPDEVVTVWASWDNFPDKTWLSVPEYQLLHQENRTLVDLALYGTSSTNFTSVDAPEQVGAAFVSPNLLDVLGVAPAAGRFAMVLLGAFAALALGLAVVGIYGVLAYSVSRRTGEIGIRLALGASAGQVVGLVVRQGFVAAFAGVAVGTVVAWYLSGLVSGMLYGVRPQDPLTFATVPLLLLVVALIACWIPAGRATLVRPATALRID